MTADHEPWVPAGHAARLVPGALVRIRLSGECQSERHAHKDYCDGIRGVVLRVHLAGAFRWHPYHVIVADNSEGHFAAAELEVLDD